MAPPTFIWPFHLVVGVVDGREGHALHNELASGSNVSGAMGGNGLATISLIIMVHGITILYFFVLFWRPLSKKGATNVSY